MKILRKKGNSYKSISEKVTKATRSLVFIDGSLISSDKIILSASGIWKILNQ